MSKSNNFSYEGFRRKNSLNSIDNYRNSTSPDVSFMKLKHNEHLSEMDELSMQLDSLSKRTHSSRSFCEENTPQYRSSTNLREFSDGVAQNSKINTMRKQELIVEEHKTLHEIPKLDKFSHWEKKEYISSSAVFNKFEIIQEDPFLNEQQQPIEQIQPVTFKQNPNLKVDKKTIVLKNISAKPASFHQIRKPPVTSRPEPAFKKDKIKQELNELDKMQKQLDLKRSIREQHPKIHSHGNVLKRGKEPISVKESIKMNKTTTQIEKIRNRNDLKSSSHLTQSANLIQIKQEKTESNNEQGFQIKTVQMAATRMLADKEKLNLINKILSIKDIIQKNEICSQNLDEITSHLGLIQKLLTQ